MNITRLEEKILRKIGEVRVTTKLELKKDFNIQGSPVVIETATKGLIEKDLIKEINPIGSTCFIITKKGSELLTSLNI